MDKTVQQPYVFISYASADRERVKLVVDLLSEAGITCWLDEHDIAGGANWGGSIANAIEGCSAFILMSSAASLMSRNVRQEIALAWQHDKPYIPLRLDTTPIPNDVAYWLATAQWIEVLDHPADAWLPKVAHALSRIRDHPSTVAVPVAPDGVKQQRLAISLPSPPSSFVGREREVAEIAALLHTERIVTLVGPGGIGKTRVAIAVGHRLTEEYRDGVIFVDLAPLRDSALVLPTVAAALGVRESAEVALANVLATSLRSRHLLLILDNLEHVIEAAGDISRLINSCPALAVLATSREPLRISGEVEYPLTSLLVPSPDRSTDIDHLRANPTVALFVQRAQSSRPSFDLTPDNVDAVAAICQRLDGLPLAIELAAARIRLLSPQALVERLNEPLRVLTGGARDLPDRQRTIRDTIQWSYDLLTPDEQRLVRRLSVCVGGWTLASAAAIASADGDLSIDLLDGLTSLTDKSLVIRHEQPDGDARFGMLALIRDFAGEQLSASGEADRIRDAQTAYIAGIADQLEAAFGQTAAETPLLARLRDERDNVRTALNWCAPSAGADAGRVAIGARIAAHCMTMWDVFGLDGEGARWLRDYADAIPSLPVGLATRVLSRCGYFTYTTGDWTSATALLQQAVERADDTRDALAGVESRIWLSVIHTRRGDVTVAQPLAQAALDLALAARSDAWVRPALMNLARVAMARDDYAAAQAVQERLLTAPGAAGDPYTVMITTVNLGWMALRHGDHDAAAQYAAETQRLNADVHHDLHGGSAAVLSARVALERGDVALARQTAALGIEMLRAYGSVPVLIGALGAAALIAVASGEPHLAARLSVVVRATDMQPMLSVARLDDLDQAEVHARVVLGEVAFERLQCEAVAMTLDDAVAEVTATFTSNVAG